MKLIKLLIALLTTQPKLVLATNEAQIIATCTATNELVMDGEWLRVTPFGDFPNKVGLQRVQKEDGEQLVTAFNSLKGRLARGFMGIPIYVGHPDVSPEKYPDKRRYGRINELQTREDGVYGLVAWNDLGKQVMENGHYLYDSPTWYLRKDGAHIRPMQLVSVGLTNTPQIPNEPWAKNEADNTLNWLKELLIKHGLLGKDEASDDEQGKISGIIAGLIADRAKLTETESAKATAEQAATTAANERDGLQTQLTAANERYTKRCLDLAVTSGRITQAQRAEWETKFATDPIMASNELDTLKKPAISTTSKVDGLGKRKEGESNQGSEKIVAINDAVKEAAITGGFDLATNEGHNKAYAAAKKAKPELFASSN
jgi:hypothetical protein